MQITAIILAGGKSRRMGTDKAFLLLNNHTLLDCAIKICQPFCKSILISSNSVEHKKIGYNIIPDEILDCGPMGGILSCLKETETEWNFVISVDSPFVEPELIQFLITEIGEFDAVVPVHSKGKEPLIALYHKNSLVEIEKKIESGNFKMHDLLKTINTKFVDVQELIEKYPKIFHNLNRPEDL